MHNSGTYVWKNGNKYEGQWVDGDMEGKCIFTYACGNYYKGNYKKGEQQG